LSEEVPGSLQLGAFVALNKVREVGLPQILHVRPLEQRQPSLIYLEGLLPGFMFLQGKTVCDSVKCEDPDCILLCIICILYYITLYMSIDTYINISMCIGSINM